MYEYSPTDETHVRVIGRTVRKDPMPVFWTASGISFDTDSTECYLDIECDHTTHEVYLRVEIDGVLFQRMLVPAGHTALCLFKLLPAGQLKTVTVIAEAQPVQDDVKRKLLFGKIRSDLVLQPVVSASLRIEFVGDSLTSGEGLTGTGDFTDWCMGIYGLTGHYALAVAKHFDAEYSIVSQSGWGVYCGWDNNPHTNIPRIYEAICGPLAGKDNEALGAHEPWDFDSWKPDLIIVNLGTNDAAALGSPGYTDPETGTVTKMNAAGDGRPDDESKEKFETAVYDFLKKIRRCNPGSYILWVYGMCGPVMEPYITGSIDRYTEDTGDNRVSFFALEECPEEELGAHFHPGASHHLKCAGMIIDEIDRLNILKR